MKVEERQYAFKVNGTTFAIENRTPSAFEILAIAKEGNAIADNPSEYILQGEKGRYSADEKIDLEEDNVFMAVHSGATPVALAGGKSTCLWTLPKYKRN